MASNSNEKGTRELSTDELRNRVDEHYNPCAGEEGQWYRCQRETEQGTSCNRKAFFPTGVLAHENYHSITSGDGPLVRPDHGQSTSGASSGGQDETSTVKPKTDPPNDDEILEQIRSEVEREE